ncbi:hypothetical protein CALVIDRAFT_109778 [Calocera viscosa TUFC12733]|uniref:Uncharacterized protein n=1 Tax=Calocera viscosa (strain TUFC12733) TaxID=1330018 RepID=A0A167MF34_CALVF|nr:hypothetical protein CALVIDRAFT_109778 [Calocera viscosa TUFC12733]
MGEGAVRLDPRGGLRERPVWSGDYGSYLRGDRWRGGLVGGRERRCVDVPVGGGEFESARSQRAGGGRGGRCGRGRTYTIVATPVAVPGWPTIRGGAVVAASPASAASIMVDLRRVSPSYTSRDPMGGGDSQHTLVRRPRRPVRTVGHSVNDGVPRVFVDLCLGDPLCEEGGEEGEQEEAA